MKMVPEGVSVSAGIIDRRSVACEVTVNLPAHTVCLIKLWSDVKR
jgi:hypothetical protein